MSFKGKRKKTLDVCAKRCDQCLFSSNKIVSDERKERIIKEIGRKDGTFTCHKHTIAGRDVQCRGDYDRDPRRTLAMRLALAFGLVRFIDENGNENGV